MDSARRSRARWITWSSVSSERVSRPSVSSSAMGRRPSGTVLRWSDSAMYTASWSPVAPSGSSSSIAWTTRAWSVVMSSSTVDRALNARSSTSSCGRSERTNSRPARRSASNCGPSDADASTINTTDNGCSSHCRNRQDWGTPSS